MLEKVKVLFSEVPQREVALASYELMDGQKIEAEVIEVGAAVMIEGQPAADGDYVLMTGETLVVSEGLIKEVKQVEVEEEEMKEDKFAAIEQRFAKQDETIGNLTLALSKNNDAVQGLIDIVGEMVKTPAEPIEEKRDFKAEAYENKMERFERFTKAIKQLKK